MIKDCLDFWVTDWTMETQDLFLLKKATQRDPELSQVSFGEREGRGFL